MILQIILYLVATIGYMTFSIFMARADGAKYITGPYSTRMKIRVAMLLLLPIGILAPTFNEEHLIARYCLVIMMGAVSIAIQIVFENVILPFIAKMEEQINRR